MLQSRYIWRGKIYHRYICIYCRLASSGDAGSTIAKNTAAAATLQLAMRDPPSPALAIRPSPASLTIQAYAVVDLRQYRLQRLPLQYRHSL